MAVNTALAQLSNGFLLAALVGYSLAMVAFAGDFAYGRHQRRGGAAVREESPRQARVPEPAAAAAAGAIPAAASAPEAPAPPGTDATVAAGPPGPPGPPADVSPGSAFRAAAQAGGWVRAALILAGIGMAAHLAGVISRGLAVGRLPWGDMYEYVTALTCVAVAFFAAVMLRYRAWSLGLFVFGAVVIALGLAETVIYTPAGPLMPALQSYWLSIHVTAMVLATGVFFVAAVLGVVYLGAERHERLAAAGRAAADHGIMRRLPGAEALDRLAYRTVVFGFPVWTFGLIAGAIWADQAWGRYWGWDPVETWAFITWVVYAGFLHARATAGWRGRRAAWIQLAGFGCLLFNVIGVQVFITGLHSYAGLS